MKNIIRYTFILLVGAIFSTAAVYAQQQQQQMPPQPEPLSPEEVTDEDLQMVASVSQTANGIQREADEKMREVVEGEGMEYNRFQEIMMAQQNPQMAGDVEMSEDEQATLQQVQPDLMQINQEARQQYMAAIEDEGMSVQKFQQIAQAIQAHPEVAERFEEINGSESGGSDN